MLTVCVDMAGAHARVTGGIKILGLLFADDFAVASLTPVKSGLSPLLTGVLCSRLQRATLSDAVRIQFVLLKMGMLMLETCRG